MPSQCRDLFIALPACAHRGSEDLNEPRTAAVVKIYGYVEAGSAFVFVCCYATNRGTTPVVLIE